MKSNPNNVQTPEWFCLRQGKLEAAWNMALDDALLAAAPQLGRPLLRFYGWIEPAATFGYSQRYETVARWTALRPLVRRPTGGGLVPHDRDFTYTLVFPEGHDWHRLRARDSYWRVHDWVCRALRRVGLVVELATVADPRGAGQCFAGAEQHDVVCGGIKVAGAAQRRTHGGLLIQGSVQVGGNAPDRVAFEDAMRAVASEAWGVTWIEFDLDDAVCAEAQRLEREKYAKPAYNLRR